LIGQLGAEAEVGYNESGLTMWVKENPVEKRTDFDTPCSIE
jgi:hypothetical protein